MQSYLSKNEDVGSNEKSTLLTRPLVCSCFNLSLQFSRSCLPVNILESLEATILASIQTKVANLCHRRTKATTTAISFVSLWLDQAHAIRQEVSSAVTRVVTILSRALKVTLAVADLRLSVFRDIYLSTLHRLLQCVYSC
ncbi:hypothetical protein K439DRAFT_914516 [Ramaria rubella]|nr:hypothetical protein K439DRAFT_914516 [Ramaria rubella]